MLRSIPNKFAGIAVMFSALIILILLPFIVSVNYYNQKGYTYGL
jgi:quinol-cytochrome oxidoreductase complex cytochrome b subunit